MRIFVYYIGKPRDPAVNAIAAEYEKRVNRFSACEVRELNPAKALPWTNHGNAAKVLLNPEGRTLDSPQFAALFREAEMTGRDYVFAIGGAEGFPPGWREGAEWTLSLSSMTFSHELARAMLLEQIYRAFATLRGHPYAK